MNLFQQIAWDFQDKMLVGLGCLQAKVLRYIFK
jgi:hypothetical protein